MDKFVNVYGSNMICYNSVLISYIAFFYLTVIIKQEQYPPPSTSTAAAAIGLGYGLTAEPLFPSSSNPTMSPALQTDEPSHSTGGSYHDSIVEEAEPLFPTSAAPNSISPTNYPIVTPPNLIWNVNPSTPTDEKEIEEEEEEEEEGVHHFFATPSSATSQLNIEHTGSDIDFGDYLDNFNEENGNTYGPCDTSRDGGDYSTRSRSSGVSFVLLYIQMFISDMTTLIECSRKKIF